MAEHKKILIVDDVDFNLEFEEKVIKMFTKEVPVEIEIDAVHSIAEARTLIADNPPYDAMIIDMNLPDGSGVEIAIASREKSEATRLAALTIYPSKYEEEQPFFDLFLRKPIMPDVFKESFARLLQI